jgi:hypothetical protein
MPQFVSGSEGWGGVTEQPLPVRGAPRTGGLGRTTCGPWRNILVCVEELFLNGVQSANTHRHPGCGTSAVPPRGPAHTGARRAGVVHNWARSGPQWSLHARGSHTKLSHVGAVALRARQSPDHLHVVGAAARPHCILHARNSRMPALGLACAVGQLILGVY